MAKDNAEQATGNAGQPSQGNTASSPEERKKFGLPPVNYTTPPESSKDPLTSLREIAQDKNIDPEVREWLFNYAVTRFKNRRKMAYIALMTIIGIVMFLGFGALVDGIRGCTDATTCTSILASVAKIESILIWVVGFLASIVATYYGVSSFRPSS